MGDCLDNFLENIDRMLLLCHKIEAQFKPAAKIVEEVKESPIEIGWHKLPPVPGWYASALTHHGQVEGMGTNLFTESKIRETDEQNNIWYYGPLPVKEIETAEKE